MHIYTAVPTARVCNKGSVKTPKNGWGMSSEGHSIDWCAIR